MAWTLQGRVIEHCNCNSVCPCFTSLLTRPGDNERCIGFIAINVESGTGEAEDLAGKTAVLIQDAPGNMVEGGWKVGVVVDESATEDQARRLAAIVTGDLGGPMSGFGPLMGERLGIERARIEFASENGKHSLRAGKFIDADFADMVNQGMDKPLQLINSGTPFGPPVTISPPVTSKITAFGIEIDNSGKHGTTSRIDWSSG
jgi:hypothetical protein